MSTKPKKNINKALDKTCRDCKTDEGFKVRMIIVDAPNQFHRYSTRLCKQCYDKSTYSPLPEEREFT